MGNFQSVEVGEELTVSSSQSKDCAQYEILLSQVADQGMCNSRRYPNNRTQVKERGSSRHGCLDQSLQSKNFCAHFFHKFPSKYGENLVCCLDLLGCLSLC